MLRLILIVLVCVTTWGWSECSQEEALFVRRILEFWKDKEVPLVRSQILQFIEQYPHSDYVDSLRVILGDIYWNEKEFETALKIYTAISHPTCREKVLANQFDCYVHLNQFPQLEEIALLRIPEARPLNSDKALALLVYAEALQERGLEEKAQQVFGRLKNTHLSERINQALEQQALRKAQTLFDRGSFAELIEEQKEIRPLITIQQTPAFDCLVARSYTASKRYAEAYQLLKPHVQALDGDRALNRSFLLNGIASAYQLNQLEDLQNWSQAFAKEYGDDQDLPHVLYLVANSLRNGDKCKAAAPLYAQILEQFPLFEKREQAAFEYALCLYKQALWDQSRLAFAKFLNEYPQSSLKVTALHYLPTTSLNDPKASLEERLEDLKKVVDYPEAVKGSYVLKYGKLLYENQEKEKAIAAIEPHLNLFTGVSECVQAHLLLAACYQHESPQNFIFHGEKVLALQPHFADRLTLRHNLFSACWKLQKYEEAAEHLYQVLWENKKGEKPENALWLANYIYDKLAAGRGDYALEPISQPDLLRLAQRGIFVFETVLDADPEIQPETLSLEQDFYKLSVLYGWVSQPEAQRDLLEKIREQQLAHPEWDWKLPTRTLYSLAHVLQQQQEALKALDLYRELMAQSKTTDAYLQQNAKLNWAILTFAQLPAEKKTLTDPEMTEILKTLKDLQIRKTLALEPLHLEAGLAYVEFRSKMEPPAKQTEQKLFSYRRMKEDFTLKNDICAKEYHTLRGQSPDKDLIYQAYMLLLDAHILTLESTLARAQGKREEAELKQEAARTLYRSLTQGKFAVSKYLVDQAQFVLNKKL